MDERMPTGISGLDEVVHGGLITQNSYLIVGGPGTGKTILSFQWLLEGQRRGEAALYITLAEPGGKIERNVRSFGWQLDGIKMVDLTPTLSQSKSPEAEYQVFHPSEVERTPLWQGIYDAVEEHKPVRLVIDSITQLRYLSTDEYQFRKQMLALVSFLDGSGCTSFLIFEPTELEKETSVALAVDGIIRLNREVSPGRIIGLRSIEVEKLRGSDFMSGLNQMRIGERGVEIFPHRIEKPSEVKPGKNLLATGIVQLDELLGGGLESGTTTIITGPAGAGKSTLGMKFLSRSVTAGDAAILYAFEESVQSIVTRCEGVGLRVQNMIDKGTLQIVRVNPMELYPDEFLCLVRKAVEEEGRRIVMVDSLRGYELAMEEFGTMVANISNLVTYLNGKGVTTLLINEVENITGDLKATEFAVSYVADNIILLRYAEYNSRVIKIIACLKKRLGMFQPELREMHITSDGIEVSEKLENLRGILTGVPIY
ncbi:MAG TPA: ATPase domain-containing protein [Pyrinomonadaceae bacterium]|nr:ATPase domain-containing protein [Pyrinomonadaceae bacterium]